MDIYSLIDRLNNELDKLNKFKNEEFDTRDFFTDNIHFNDDLNVEDFKKIEENVEKTEIDSSTNVVFSNTYADIEPDNETKALIEVKPSYLITAQTMFKRTIKFSLKSFLISISLSFLNLFI